MSGCDNLSSLKLEIATASPLINIISTSDVSHTKGVVTNGEGFPHFPVNTN